MIDRREYLWPSRPWEAFFRWVDSDLAPDDKVVCQSQCAGHLMNDQVAINLKTIWQSLQIGQSVQDQVTPHMQARGQLAESGQAP